MGYAQNKNLTDNFQVGDLLDLNRKKRNQLFEISKY